MAALARLSWWCLSEHPLPILFPLPRPLWALPLAMVAQALLHLHGHGRTGAEDRSLQAQGKSEGTWPECL